MFVWGESKGKYRFRIPSQTNSLVIRKLLAPFPRLYLMEADEALTFHRNPSRTPMPKGRRFARVKISQKR